MLSNKVLYFSGLNGIRAIAAIAVVISHITFSLKDFGLDPYLFGSLKDGTPKGYMFGGYGVSMFFVLSGFLITYLLLEEKKNQPIDIKKFYIRRIFRIWPLYYLYLIISLITLVYINFDLNYKSLFFYIFYSANIPFILSTGFPFVGHYWSLGVEEQFYLFWPWLIKKSSSIIIIIFLIIALLGLKVGLHLFYPNSILELAIHVSRFHCMMIGAIGAIFYFNKNKIFLKYINNKITQSVCLFLLLLVAINKFHFISVIDNEIISVIALGVIIGQIEIKNRILNLETNVLNFLGKISYGIYIVHPLLIFFFSKTLGQLSVDLPYKYFIIYSTIISTTILISYVSFTYFEKIFLNYKSKFTIVKSSGIKPVVMQ